MKQALSSEKLTQPRQQKLFFLLCWTAYFSTYIGRLNFSASLAEIAHSGSFSQTELGLVSSGFFIGYGIFQLIFGILGDRLNPVGIVFSGIFCSGLLNLSMVFVKTAQAMVALWTINGVVQSAVWSPLLRLTVDCLPRHEAMLCSVRYSTTVPFGTFTAYALAAICIALSHWRTVFAVSGSFLLVVSLCWLRGMKELVSKRICIKATTHTPVPLPSTKHASISWQMIILLIPVCLAAVVNGIIRDGIQTWLPTYLWDIHGLSGVSSIVLTLVLPIVNLSGVYLGNETNNRIFHNETATASAALTITCLLLMILALGVTPPLWVELGIFGLCASMMLAVNTMLVTLLPMHLQDTGRVSALSGLMNSATYIGSALSGYGFGFLLEHIGWNRILWSGCMAALCTAGLCAVISIEWKQIRK